MSLSCPGHNPVTCSDSSSSARGMRREEITDSPLPRGPALRLPHRVFAGCDAPGEAVASSGVLTPPSQGDPPSAHLTESLLAVLPGDAVASSGGSQCPSPKGTPPTALCPPRRVSAGCVARGSCGQQRGQAWGREPAQLCVNDAAKRSLSLLGPLCPLL